MLVADAREQRDAVHGGHLLLGDHHVDGILGQRGQRRLASGRVLHLP